MLFVNVLVKQYLFVRPRNLKNKNLLARCNDLLNQKEQILLERWIEFGDNLNISEIIETLKPLKNCKVEIANYHLCRFTNAFVEEEMIKLKRSSAEAISRKIDRFMSIVFIWKVIVSF